MHRLVIYILLVISTSPSFALERMLDLYCVGNRTIEERSFKAVSTETVFQQELARSVSLKLTNGRTDLISIEDTTFSDTECVNGEAHIYCSNKRGERERQLHFSKLSNILVYEDYISNDVDFSRLQTATLECASIREKCMPGPCLEF